jgi:hypothetical protein
MRRLSVIAAQNLHPSEPTAGALGTPFETQESYARLIVNTD